MPRTVTVELTDAMIAALEAQPMDPEQDTLEDRVLMVLESFQANHENGQGQGEADQPF